ncbi:hypothetical protein F4821DRAFT_275484 [Hypoxylon rubiginosum]|uniref:Uncharacterized protein n=1 Tax=Hypoxylon rubiginosum TaxID=110542 RepID=A0ACC0CKJ0_9PEZI|nr:hypothetical protein F4821DRAFT_275484 [Hypoxylon rubiginosum]
MLFPMADQEDSFPDIVPCRPSLIKPDVSPFPPSMGLYDNDNTLFDPIELSLDSTRLETEEDIPVDINLITAAQEEDLIAYEYAFVCSEEEIQELLENGFPNGPQPFSCSVGSNDINPIEYDNPEGFHLATHAPVLVDLTGQDPEPDGRQKNARKTRRQPKKADINIQHDRKPNLQVKTVSLSFSDGVEEYVWDRRGRVWRGHVHTLETMAELMQPQLLPAWSITVLANGEGTVIHLA